MCIFKKKAILLFLKIKTNGVGMLKDLIKIANKLDTLGFRREADTVDSLIKKFAGDKAGEYSATFDSASYIANRTDPMDNDGNVSTVFGYIIAAFGEPFGFKNPYYKIIGEYDGSGFTLASNTLDCLGMNHGDFKKYVKEVEEEGVHQIMMSQYIKNIESLPDEHPRKIKFYQEINNIISVLRGLGVYI